MYSLYPLLALRVIYFSGNMQHITIWNRCGSIDQSELFTGSMIQRNTSGFAVRLRIIINKCFRPLIDLGLKSLFLAYHIGIFHRYIASHPMISEIAI